MEEKTMLPNGLYDVWIVLDTPVMVWPWEGSHATTLHCQMWLSDYISLMRDIKTRSFVAFWEHVLNKMHITEIKSSLSPILTMSIGWFVHNTKSGAFEEWLTWEELYEKRCDNLSDKFGQNKLLHHN